MTATVHALADGPEGIAQLDFFDASVYRQDLFSLTSANNHALDEGIQLRAGQHVRFEGTGTVVECTLKGFGDDTKRPVRVYKITCNEAVVIV